MGSYPPGCTGDVGGDDVLVRGESVASGCDWPISEGDSSLDCAGRLRRALVELSLYGSYRL